MSVSRDGVVGDVLERPRLPERVAHLAEELIDRTERGEWRRIEPVLRRCRWSSRRDRSIRDGHDELRTREATEALNLLAHHVTVGSGLYEPPPCFRGGQLESPGPVESLQAVSITAASASATGRAARMPVYDTRRSAFIDRLRWDGMGRIPAIPGPLLVVSPAPGCRRQFFPQKAPRV